MNGNAGGSIFSVPPAGTTGAAGDIRVVIADPSLIAASSDGTAGSNGNLANLSAVATQAVAGGQTPINFYSNLVFQVGNTTSNASADADATHLSAAGYAEFHSIASNATRKAGR